MTTGEEAQAGEASPADLFRGIDGVRFTHGGPVLVNSFYAPLNGRIIKRRYDRIKS